MTFQPAPILYPDVELWACDFMRDALDGRGESYAQNVYVSNSVSNPRHPRMVIFRRDGGQAAEMRDNARVSVRVWAAVEQEAVDLARLVNALLWSAPNGTPVLRVQHESGPTPVADESKAFLRYSLHTISLRGEAVA